MPLVDVTLYKQQEEERKMTTLVWRDFEDDKRCQESNGKVLRIKEGARATEDKEEEKQKLRADRGADPKQGCNGYAKIRTFRVSYTSERGRSGGRYTSIKVQEDGGAARHSRSRGARRSGGVQRSVLGDKKAEGPDFPGTS